MDETKIKENYFMVVLVYSRDRSSVPGVQEYLSILYILQNG